MELETGNHVLLSTAQPQSLSLYIYLNSTNLVISHLCKPFSSSIALLCDFLHLTATPHILDSSNKLLVTFKNQILSTDLLVTSIKANQMPPANQWNYFTCAFPSLKAHLSIKKALIHRRFAGKHGLYESLQIEWSMKRSLMLTILLTQMFKILSFL